MRRPELFLLKIVDDDLLGVAEAMGEEASEVEVVFEVVENLLFLEFYRQLWRMASSRR